MERLFSGIQVWEENPHGPGGESGLSLDFLLCLFSCTKRTRAPEQDTKERKDLLGVPELLNANSDLALFWLLWGQGAYEGYRGHLVHTAAVEACNGEGRTQHLLCQGEALTFPEIAECGRKLIWW